MRAVYHETLTKIVDYFSQSCGSLGLNPSATAVLAHICSVSSVFCQSSFGLKSSYGVERTRDATLLMPTTAIVVLYRWKSDYERVSNEHSGEY